MATTIGSALSYCRRTLSTSHTSYKAGSSNQTREEVAAKNLLVALDASYTSSATQYSPNWNARMRSARRKVAHFLAVGCCFVLFCSVSRGMSARTIASRTFTSLPLEPTLNSILRPGSSPESIRTYVATQAGLYGVNPRKAVWIVDHESQDGRNMRGDSGHSRGYFMISNLYHPEVATGCADDLPCATAWTMKRILAGRINDWTTYKYCRRWYPQTCPF
jgi:hypothetical protein